MSEALSTKQAFDRDEAEPALKLLALYEAGDEVGANKVTLAMIGETAEWIKLDLANAELAGQRVRAWWLKQVQTYGDGDDAEEFEDRWDIAFEKAKTEQRTTEGTKLDAIIAETTEEPEPAGEPEADGPELEARAGPEREAEYVEDAGNAANDILRKLWRITGALSYLKPEAWADEVGAVLWRMSKGNREAGCKVWVDWMGEEARARWHVGFDHQRGSIEAIYRAAQVAGWRYPLAQNLNRDLSIVWPIDAPCKSRGSGDQRTKDDGRRA
jgi:hypothetical protein